MCSTVSTLVIYYQDNFKIKCLFSNEHLKLNSSFTPKNRTYILLIIESNHNNRRK